ncbi:hypothetical protein, partial [Yersinia pestis]|uniref:hypothetical protein n=1 Tax=Yersinia pestis TaxID=632 RepID=UPI001ED9898C
KGESPLNLILPTINLTRSVGLVTSVGLTMNVNSHIVWLFIVRCILPQTKRIKLGGRATKS